ncbi:hypothetical protein RISK_003540 [Rhodopirellula islandica]|uniref:Uncharacterized protein n=1 Tax=Rhodopirellula islandica TaxID=595434 RepID=A0A0J1BDB7_RHOIS|nr:hypothetical protein RISK_003540 [Rhodopirellula islandica]
MLWLSFQWRLLKPNNFKTRPVRKRIRDPSRKRAKRLAWFCPIILA